MSSAADISGLEGDGSEIEVAGSEVEDNPPVVMCPRKSARLLVLQIPAPVALGCGCSVREKCPVLRGGPGGRIDDWMAVRAWALGFDRASRVAPTARRFRERTIDVVDCQTRDAKVDGARWPSVKSVTTSRYGSSDKAACDFSFDACYALFSTGRLTPLLAFIYRGLPQTLLLGSFFHAVRCGAVCENAYNTTVPQYRPGRPPTATHLTAHCHLLLAYYALSFQP